MFNKAMLVPLSSLIAMFVNNTFAAGVTEEEVQTTLNVGFTIVAAIGMKMNWTK